MREWLRKWAIIDIVGVGLSLFLAFTYLKYGTNWLGENSPGLSLWANIATDLFGVWLSVRIIERIIRASERRPYFRRGLVDTLVNLTSTIRTLRPYYDEWQVRNLAARQTSFSTAFGKRRNFFSGREQDRLIQVISVWKELVTQAQTYVELKQNVGDLRLKLEKSGRDINLQRRSIRTIIEQYNKDTEKHTLDLPTLLSEKRQVISPSELKHFLSFSTNSQEKSLAHTSIFPGTHLFLNDVYVNTLDWYEKCNSAFSIIRDQYAYKDKDEEDIIKDLNEASLDFEKEQVNLPDGLIPISKGYLEAIKGMARERLKIEKYSEELERHINETTMAIDLPSE